MTIEDLQKKIAQTDGDVRAAFARVDSRMVGMASSLRQLNDAAKGQRNSLAELEKRVEERLLRLAAAGAKLEQRLAQALGARPGGPGGVKGGAQAPARAPASPAKPQAPQEVLEPDTSMYDGDPDELEH